MGRISGRAGGATGRAACGRIAASCALGVLALSTVLPPAHAEHAIEITTKHQGDQVQTGFATYYASRFEGRRTASGTTFRHDALVAAHPSLPFGTLARVTNLVKGKSVIVRVTDRGPGSGPRSKGVIIDLSQQAAKQLKMMMHGRVRVGVEVLASAKNGHAAQSNLHATRNALEWSDVALADGLSLRMDTTLGLTAASARVATINCEPTACPQTVAAPFQDHVQMARADWRADDAR